jgi:uncharacterized protein (TIGR03435 family)
VTSPLPARRLTVSLVFLVTSLATPIGAQEPKPAFEVASVKPSQSTRSDWNQNVQPGGRFVATNAPLVNLIPYAYAVPDYRLEHVPSWVRNERFDVAAKAEQEVSIAQIQLMLRTLLEDRFRLVIRRETRDMPVNTLVLARSDGRVGPNLVRVSGPDDCKDATTNRRDAPPGAMTTGGCGPIAGLAGLAGRHTATVVIDGTGLTGTFKFTMYYAPDLSATGDVTLPSFVTALNEQLGLRLRASRGPVEVLVIESVEQPSEN